MRLDKLLANMGYGTRKEVKKLCKSGAVKVDGEPVKDSSIHVNPDTQEVEIYGEIIQYREFVYLMMNKPQGVISATEDLVEETVVDLLDPEFYTFDVFPVGRLDKDTEGLLLLTNDGKLAHELLSPKKHVPKRYFARIEGRVTEADGAAFRAGVTLDDGYKTLPAELTILSQGSVSEIELVIYEGKYHQVKRMFEAVGKKVVYLKRIAMGALQLDEALEPGEYRELTEAEVELLREKV
ncbi:MULTISPECIES: pseudouridine synthase [Aneurinibacillus]|uniref:Pseudouridine synthase n=1 Tax=Aneurinibacillus thermoaerophilus TaxID=143495 RepID=A0A1G7WYS1_ANETH|nr:MULTISPECIES: pseudouridine synthase [Aneurinibacillus]AMA74771.1 16S rRNA pseudouridine synthase [Aneurinibacillus sp. XH2]MED0674055.1 pseudouridine synthase [Aneurinibacillus thermoaerophilus]MED0678040.1 pseudouridine synthase [Aneurinibacillus thermoaerophilus]MED0737770.1 pseudouridine synthase [Aneurinibacillus thermoaerophilus]MED0755756.1 pseudouridine synthase [Aneurinibacillus thermoaerophilus]